MKVLGSPCQLCSPQSAGLRPDREITDMISDIKLHSRMDRSVLEEKKKNIFREVYSYTYFHLPCPPFYSFHSLLSHTITLLFFCANIRHWNCLHPHPSCLYWISLHKSHMGLSMACQPSGPWLAMHILGRLMTDVSSAEFCLRCDGCFVSLAQQAFISSQQWPDRLAAYAWLHQMIGLGLQWPRPTTAAPEQEQAQGKNLTRYQKPEDKSTRWNGHRKMVNELITESQKLAGKRD